tara:strand:+ start:13413 stop:14195 length:783 start_codon:yes stop_codon:yes gene_type:complete
LKKLKNKVILFDFDGVIINGMNEYWCSSLIACHKFLKSNKFLPHENIEIPISKTFTDIRPWVKYGWEMVLITHEIIKRNNSLNHANKDKFLENYEENCRRILSKNSWHPQTLQSYLDSSRKLQISSNFDKWVSLHKPFLEVIEFIKQAASEKIKIGIISTKGKLFTSKIVNKIEISPEFIFGYESGSKVEIISKLSKELEILAFIEDRRKTLENVNNNRAINKIPCFLAEWGYLKKTDKINLPKTIKLLKLKNLKDILAN